MWKVVGAVLVLGGLAGVARAEVKLPAVFGEHMVLQREMPVPVWGWAAPGEAVVVRFNGQAKTATADAAGKWSLALDKLTAGGPYELEVQGKQNTIRLADVLVGEVWLASGQSNMEMGVGGVMNREAEIAAADHPQIRMFTVARIPAREPRSDCKGQWQVCSPKVVAWFSAAGYFFARELNKQLDIPIGVLHSSWGGTPIQTWTSLAVHQAVPELRGMAEGLERDAANFASGKAQADYQKRLADWEAAAAKAKADNKPFKQGRPQPPEEPRARAGSPAALYNGMIAPLVPYALRGAIWYQGESNAGSPIYGIQLKAMIESWRADWKQGDFPFISVQLPNFMDPQKQPSEGVGGWPLTREQFLKGLTEIPNTGIAVTIDIGEAHDIHPHNKQEVGRRLAQWALAKTYGKDCVACGPLFKTARTDGQKMVLEFDYVGGGLATGHRREAVVGGGKLKGFAIAGADKKFVWAEAQIVGRTVVVSSPEVKEPAAVRYAWANNPDCNLMNQAGLAASPFRTDDWR
jgi:sialate O-acetylesterase